jgi:hypothetical protein
MGSQCKSPLILASPNMKGNVPILESQDTIKIWCTFIKFGYWLFYAEKLMNMCVELDPIFCLTQLSIQVPSLVSKWIVIINPHELSCITRSQLKRMSLACATQQVKSLYLTWQTNFNATTKPQVWGRFTLGTKPLNPKALEENPQMLRAWKLWLTTSHGISPLRSQVWHGYLHGNQNLT